MSKGLKPVLILALIALSLFYVPEMVFQHKSYFETPQSDQCKSRLEYSTHLRGSSSFTLSKSLLHLIRSYESLHAACASNASSSPIKDCQYVVFVPSNGRTGVGNKMVSLVSTFLYALLTNRVMLISQMENLDQLFCEPFPESSWLLPSNMSHISVLNETVTLGNLVSSLDYATGPSKFKLPKLVYAELSDYYKRNDEKFFLEEHQAALRQQVPWLVTISDQYFATAMYLVPSFKARMDELFPEPESLFHLLGRYLLHPSNLVWEKTTRFYDAHLAQADLLVGIQIRVSLWFHSQTFAEDALRCLIDQHVLPNVTTRPVPSRSRKNILNRSVAVLLTSLQRVHFDYVNGVYGNHTTVDGSSVAVYQPSQEGEQNTGNLEHDVKALMEIYLLSMTDSLITSPTSTFGYSAHGLMGRPPLQLSCEGGRSCFRRSMQPCYHRFPSTLGHSDDIRACECYLGFMLRK